MARDMQKRTVREEVTLADPRPTQLNTTRRFFSNQGNDRATREARALENFFQAGTEFVANRQIADIKEGREEAITSAAAGEARDLENQNQGYNAAWDQLDAQNDLNRMEDEIPELLRQADWENLEDEDVRKIIDDYMVQEFDGIEPNSVYGRAIAPGLLELEQRFINQHREMELDRIQQTQRVQIYENAGNLLRDAGGDPNVPVRQLDGSEKTFYEYLADQTNIFFDGSDKMVAYWESIFDYAITNGMPEIIEQVPERFPNGDPTMKTDPEFRDEYRAALREATNVQARRIADEQAAREAQYDADRFAVQLEMLQAVADGGTGIPQIGKLAAIPGTDLGDISTARNFATSFRDDVHEVNADLTMVAAMWSTIHRGDANQQQVWEALMRGELGTGRPAIKLFNDMVNKINSLDQQNETDDNGDIQFFRSRLDKLYAPALGGMLTAVDPLTHRVNLSAHLYYQAQIDQGNSPDQAFMETQARFDPILSSAPTLNEDELNVERRRPQSDFEATQLVTDDLLKKVASGERNFIDTFGGINAGVISFRVAEANESGVLSDEEATNLLMNIY